MTKWVRAAIALLCLMGFVFVRFRESELFYDPLITFYKGYYQNSPLPEIEMSRFLASIGLRYAIHMALSLLILWVVFLEKGIIKFALILYALVFVILLGLLLYLLQFYEIGDAGAVFYVRRFLIQPLLILLLLPAFFYYRKVNS